MPFTAQNLSVKTISPFPGSSVVNIDAHVMSQPVSKRYDMDIVATAPRKLLGHAPCCLDIDAADPASIFVSKINEKQLSFWMDKSGSQSHFQPVSNASEYFGDTINKVKVPDLTAGVNASIVSPPLLKLNSGNFSLNMVFKLPPLEEETLVCRIGQNFTVAVLDAGLKIGWGGGNYFYTRPGVLEAFKSASKTFMLDVVYNNNINWLRVLLNGAIVVDDIALGGISVSFTDTMTLSFMYVAQVLLYNITFTNTQLRSVHNFLRAKWNVYSPVTVDTFFVLGGKATWSGAPQNDKGLKVEKCKAFWMDSDNGDIGSPLLGMTDPVETSLYSTPWPSFVDEYFARTGRWVVVACHTPSITTTTMATHWDHNTGSDCSAAKAYMDQVLERIAKELRFFRHENYIIWHQGFGDTSSLYREAMQKTFTALLAPKTITSIFVIPIGRTKSTANDTNLDAIRDAQYAVCLRDSRVVIIYQNCKDFREAAIGYMYSVTQYNEYGNVAIGRGVAREIAEHVGGRVRVGSTSGWQILDDGSGRALRIDK